MSKLYSIFSVCLFLLLSTISEGQCDYNQSTLLFNMDECLANYAAPSETEYVEFTAIADTFPGGTILSVIGGHLYRENGIINKHSCSESYDSTAAMCVGSLDNCTYIADSDKAIRFDIKVELGSDGIGRLSGLSFHEAAPLTFNWLNNGNSGPNNHPTKYALRVSVNNVTVFEEIDIETTPEYTLESFDFSNIAAFRVTEMTEFNFELLPYCLAGIESTVSAWDIDNIIITANAEENVNGGELLFEDGTISKDICTGDGNADNINLIINNNFGTTSEYLITDIDSVIIAYDVVFPYDFDGENNGTCLVWSISYYETITDNEIGANITDIIGCYDLSNSITLIKTEVDGGIIAGGPYDFCVGDGIADNIDANDITLTNNLGANGTWVITDQQGEILGLPSDYSNVDFDEAGTGICLIRFLSYEDGLFGDIVGNNILDIQGCFAISNAITVTRNARPNVTIIHTSTLCGDDNGSATASSSLGQAPFTYNWSNGISGISINDLAAGTYTVTVTDANGCNNTESTTIEDSTSPSLFISPTGTSCGENNGSAVVTTTNGTAPFTYEWSNGMSGSSINNLSSGNYDVTVTDSNGCTDTNTFSIDSSEAPIASTNGEGTSCGEDNGSAIISATEGQSPYTYLWNTGSTNNNLSNLSAGNYRVTVTDANGCTDWADIDIDPSTIPAANASATPTTCGDDNGTATVETTSGVSPYSYNWSNGGSQQNISQLEAGTYTVTVTDSEGCTITASATVDNSTSPVASINTTDTGCGQDDGSASVNASSGTSPYTYSWSNGETTPTISNLASGTYTVTVTDDQGCTVTNSTTIGGSNNPTATTNVISNTSCGEDNGAATVSAINGVAPYSYAWSNGSTNTSISDLEAGSYTVTVTDAEGCTSVATATINDSSAPIANAIATPTICGDDNGTATVETTSGVSPYSYAWSNGGSQQNISQLEAGTYNVTVTDSEGCITTASTTVDNSTPPVASINTTDTGCGQDDGSASANASSGTSPYTYSWSNGETTPTISNLSSGTYTVTVTDDQGCTVTNSTTIGGSNNPTATTNVISNTSCGGDNGAATVSAINGVAPYSYAWSNGSTNTSISNLEAGSYTVTVTDAEGCTSLATATINDSSAPMTNVIATPTTCGDDNGTATVETTSGVSPYSYAWSNGGSQQNISQLAAGTYTVTVTDSEGCTITASSTVDNSTSPISSINTTDTGCGQDDGSASVNASSGTAPYTYSWSNGETTPTISNLSSGTYTVTVTDDQGCTVTNSTTIGGSNNPIATTNVISNTTCGEDNGAATVSAINGVAPYSYAWSNGSTNTSISNLEAGSYTVTVTDAEGCTSIAVVSINDSSAPMANASATPTTCGDDNGTATVETTSGVSPYSYIWSNGGSQQNIFQLAAGTYTVTITDSEGCITTASTTVDNSTSPVVSINTTDTGCGQDDGSASANASSGAAPYTYSWSNGETTPTISNLASGTYTVTVTDDQGCTVTNSATIGGSNNPTATTNVISNTSCGENNGAATVSAMNGVAPYSYAWSNGSTNTSISNLEAGNYSVTVTDAEGCTSIAAASINDSSAPMANASATPTTCGDDNGTATVETTSGESPYSYNWSNGGSQQNISQLAAGTYTVTVTDSEGCTTTASSSVGNSTLPIATTTSMNTECGEDNGSATVNASNGIAPYTYSWSNGETSQTIINLSSGTYNVTVTDAAGCAASSSTMINGSSNPTATISVVSNTICGEDNGTATVSVISGISPYSYNWSNGSTNTSISDLEAGNYTVTVTDAEGCTSVATATINDSSAPMANAIATPTTCGDDNGTATVETTSGVSPYSYNWSNGGLEQNISQLAAGTYTVTVTDSEGCTTTASSSVGNSTLPIATTTSMNTECGEDNGSATVNASNGIAPYTYSWSNGETSQTIINLSSGTYNVTVTDAAGCAAASSTMINDSSNPIATISVVSNTICGEDNGAATVSVISGISPYSYNWSNGSTNSSISDLAAGTYTVTVTDAEGCTIETSIDIVDSITPNGGDISIAGETHVDFCLEGTMDMISELSLTNEVGTNMTWFITAEDGNILHLLDYNEITTFDFEDQNIGTCFIYHSSFEEAMNITIGNNLSEFSGCYDLSNAITVTKYEALLISESSLLIDMELCAANKYTSEPEEYTEFFADINNDEDCATLSVIGDNLYRNNPEINKHSCTEGVDGNVAMCVSSEESCDYNPNSEKAIILDIEIDPNAINSTRLSELTFFEKAPLTYDWIDGVSGINNYPTKFGIRVLKGSNVIFEESDITTQQEWNERTFLFTGDDFLVTETTTFRIELLAYCVIDNGEEVTAWDIDELSIITECINEFEAGTLTGGPYEICRDGQPDYITNIALDGAEGDIIKLVLVDDIDNSIIANFNDLTELSTFDFESILVGKFKLFNVSAASDFSGCEVGNIFKVDFEGCFKISNPLLINITPCGSKVIAFPNPTKSTITLNNIHTVFGKKTISVYDSMGRLVKSYTVPKNIITSDIDLSENNPGIYTIQITGTKGRSIVKSIIKLN